MSVKLDGIDLNFVVDSIEANNEAGLDNPSVNETLRKNPGDLRIVRGFSRFRGEGNGTFNDCGSVLKGEMGAVDREESLKAEIGTVNNKESKVKEKNLENEEEFVGGVTERCDGNLGLELKRVGNGEVETTIERDQNQGTGINVLPQYGRAGEYVVDLNATHRSHGDTISDGVYNGIGDNEYLIELNLPVSDGVMESMAPITESEQNGNLNLLTKDKIIKGLSEHLDEKDVKHGALKPDVRAKENQTEKEGEYHVSDLVWGKVRSHPWWPGQIFEPSAASEKAMKYFKKDSYLIAYFGDQTFAWNEASKIKPFRMYFSQMDKQSNSETFSHAVDDALNEVSRRIESGLVCQCLPEEVLASVNTQVVVSAGIQEQSSRRSTDDSLSNAGSFSPENLVNYLQLLAKAPNAAIDRLEFVMARAQFLAFNKWKGYLQLPVLEDFDGIENEADPSRSQANGMMQGVLECEEDGQVLSGKAKSSTLVCSRKRKHLAADDQCKKHIMELVHGSSSSLPNGENTYEGKATRKSPSGSTRQKRTAPVVSNESGLKRRKGLYLQSATNTASSLPKKHIKVGERMFKVTGKLGGSSPSPEGSIVDRAAIEHGGKYLSVYASGVSTMSNGNSLSGSLSVREYPPTDQMLSYLVVAAKNPEDYSSLISVAGFFSDFRNLICMEYNDLQKKKESSGKRKVEKSAALESIGVVKFGGMEDSYWTDRIIESTQNERVLFEPETDAEKDSLVAEPEMVGRLNPNAANDHERNAMVAGLDVENLSNTTGEKSNELSPTALILNFTDLESVPSITNLNEIFNRYGPLSESETQVLSKSKRAKVVFKRRSDAETAFSSTGKFSIFGPSLVSYRLKYSPALWKASTAAETKGRKKNSTSAEDG